MAVVIGIALLAWLVLGGDDDDGGQANEPQAVSVEELQGEAGSGQIPVFWAGPQAGTTYEFTETSDGSVYVRYLPEDAEVGDPSPDFLTVATYPLENGYAACWRPPRRRGQRPRSSRTAAWRRSTPTAPPASTSRTRASPTRSRSTTRRRTGRSSS